MTTAEPRTLPKTLPDLIQADGGYVEWTVEMLLGLFQVKAAGVRIIEGIEKELAALNIGYLPARIPRDRARRVLLYNQDRPGLGMMLHHARELATDPDLSQSESDGLVILLTSYLNEYKKAIEDASNTAQESTR